MGVRQSMKVTVLGLWHLGCVTAACCAKHFDVVGLDFDAVNLARLQSGHAPLLEPGLDELLQAGLASGRLRFTNDLKSACAKADILWVAYDTPVDDHDQADPEFVLREVRRCVPALAQGALVLLSSQLPVGTCRLLESEFGAQDCRFACSPENLRLGKALDAFTQADRVIAGCRDDRSKAQLAELFAPFTREVIWMCPESAEMTKHAINSFLALSITFMNEIGRLCEITGADAREVERGLKSEGRIGPKAYLSPGAAFAGGTLALARVRAASRFEVRACDPPQPALPVHLAFIQFKPGVPEALDGADAVVVCTEWPEFRALDWPALLPRLRRPLVIDATRFLEKSLAGQPRLQYVTGGSPAGNA